MMSIAEALANVVVGYGLAVATQIVVFPAFGFHPSVTQNLRVGLVFTVLSLARGYALRRLFERLRGPR